MMCADDGLSNEDITGLREYMEECERLQNVVDEFSTKMSDKLIDKAAEGYRGWDDPANRDMLVRQIREHVEREDWVDVANLAMMLWNLDRRR